MRSANGQTTAPQDLSESQSVQGTGSVGRIGKVVHVEMSMAVMEMRVHLPFPNGHGMTETLCSFISLTGRQLHALWVVQEHRVAPERCCIALFLTGVIPRPCAHGIWRPRVWER